MHPSAVLFAEGEHARELPVVDHYSGRETLMRKSLAKQAELGPLFDVTLDCEDGAEAGREAAHARLVAALVNDPDLNRHGRVGARAHPVDHPAFADDVATLVGGAGARLAYLMVPKVRGLADVQRAADAVDAAAARAGVPPPPLQALIETHGGLREVFAIAAHPRIESLSFGLMDFVSAHGGAIPDTAMQAQGQFSHPLVVRAKVEIAAACHAAGIVPSHCVVTEFKDTAALTAAARRAAQEFGYTRMWSIHPAQIEPILAAFAPAAAEIDTAAAVLLAAQAAGWGPISHADALHDRASYRYYWQVLVRAARTGQPLPEAARAAFFPSGENAAHHD
ncbi:MAG: CoA ester lyase [Proteobacteria bacterium]|nr:CoA ester lyase [Pseudomonadota bacterium]